MDSNPRATNYPLCDLGQISSSALYFSLLTCKIVMIIIVSYVMRLSARIKQSNTVFEHLKQGHRVSTLSWVQNESTGDGLPYRVLEKIK